MTYYSHISIPLRWVFDLGNILWFRALCNRRFGSYTAARLLFKTGNRLRWGRVRG